MSVGENEGRLRKEKILQALFPCTYKDSLELKAIDWALKFKLGSLRDATFEVKPTFK